MNHRDLAGHAARATALVALTWNGGAALADSPRFTLDAEVGVAWQQRNDARIDNEPPNTRIDLAELTGDGPYPVGRLAFGWQINDKHGLRVLVAPLEIEETGRLARDEVFREREFAAGATTRATYRFDSYRLTYLYTLRDDPSWHLRVGGSLKVRDAEIGLGQDGIAARRPTPASCRCWPSRAPGASRPAGRPFWTRKARRPVRVAPSTLP